MANVKKTVLDKIDDVDLFNNNSKEKPTVLDKTESTVKPKEKPTVLDKIASTIKPKEKSTVLDKDIINEEMSADSKISNNSNNVVVQKIDIENTEPETTKTSKQNKNIINKLFENKTPKKSNNNEDFNNSIDNSGLAPNTLLGDPNKLLSSGEYHDITELPTELQNKYTYTKSKDNYIDGSEAQTYLNCRRISDNLPVVIKYYKNDRIVSSAVINRLQNMYNSNQNDYSKYLPQIIEFTEKYEILEYIDGKSLE
jgi:hypothetical protein